MTKPLKALSEKFVPLTGVFHMLSCNSLFSYSSPLELKQFPEALKLEETGIQVIHTQRMRDGIYSYRYH